MFLEGFPTDPLAPGSGSRREIAFVGQSFTLQHASPTTPTYAVTRSPAGATATMSGAAFTPDVAGLWQVKATVGTYSTTFELAVFPVEALTYGPLTKNPNTGATRDARKILRYLANDPHCTAAALDAVTATAPLPIIGSTANGASGYPDLSAYGG